MLSIDHVDAGYRHVRVLHDVSLTAAPGAAVGVLGPNGAGKTTLLRAIAGTCNVYGGRIVFAGQPLNGKPDYARAALGIAHVPEGRHIWPSLTVEENLLVGAWRLPRAASSLRNYPNTVSASWCWSRVPISPKPTSRITK